MKSERQNNKEEKPKQWCTYGCYGDWLHIGYITEESSEFATIITSERKSYADVETWDKRYVKKFTSLQDAVNYSLEHIPSFDIRDGPLPKQDLFRILRNTFSSEFEKEGITSI